jgi:hypothetical protein
MKYKKKVLRYSEAPVRWQFKATPNEEFSAPEMLKHRQLND